MDYTKTIIYGEPYTLQRKKRRTRHWDKPHADQVVLAYWDPAHKDDLEAN